MNKILLWTSILIWIFIASCQQENSQSKIIVVSILPEKYFVDQIMGDQFKVEVMVPPGASPANYDPTPQQLAQLSRAIIYFKIGYIGFEQSWIPKLETEYPKLPFIDLSIGVELMEISDGHSDHKHNGVEPHIWMSPKNARIIAQNIWKTACDINPQEKELFTKNLDSLLKKIDMLDTQVHDQLTNLSRNSFIIYHPALTYFAHEYGLEQIPVEREGKEPSVQYMRKVIQQAKEKDIRLIFVQKEFNQNEALTLEKEIGGKIVSIDPLTYEWLEQIKYISQQLSNYLK